ncbi:MAG: hypothetical protein QMD85_05710 [Candidatus Aenigmarchaeota archaeon]|nr:hypothetical protein [Candidatus Aenigmarchaeota archaeon]
MSKILYVDDDPKMIQLFSNYSRRLGIGIDVAISLEEASVMTSQKNYRLVISDGLEGKWKDFYKSIESSFDGRFVVLSGTPEFKEDVNDLGFDFYAKPDDTPSVISLLIEYGKE